MLRVLEEADEEEHLVLLDRAPQITSPVVIYGVMVGRRLEVGAGLERVAGIKVVGLTVKGVTAGFKDDVGDCAERGALLGIVVAGGDVYFLNASIGGI